MSSDVTTELGFAAGVVAAPSVAFFGWAQPGTNPIRRTTGSRARGAKAVMGNPPVRERKPVATIYAKKGNAHVDAPLDLCRPPGAAGRRSRRPRAAPRRLARRPHRGHRPGA